MLKTEQFFLYVTFLFLKIRCLKSRRAYCSYNSKIKKCKFFSILVNDSKSPAIKVFKTGLIYPYILPWKFKNQQNFQFFWWFFCPKNSFLKKSLLGSVCNWLFWTHFRIPWAILLWKTWICLPEQDQDVFRALRT